MKRLGQGYGWSLGILLLLMIFAPSALAVRDDYSIEFDLNDNVVAGSGTGYPGGDVGPWYYYPHSGEYIQWFYNDPFDTTRMSTIELWAYIESVQSDQFYYVDVKFGWTKPAWNLDHPNDPQPPINLTSSSQQAKYLETKVIKSMDKSKNWILEEGGTIEPRANFTVDNYNPQWLFISIKGSNARVYRFVKHDCLAGGGGGGGGSYGACCNQQTGTCYQSKQEDCPSTNHWLGAGSDCASCQAATAIWDFGDAPSIFPVLLADNGARHLVQDGVYLGNGVTREPDGMPNATATGDLDDGVTFSSQLIPGSAGIVRIRASTYGVVSAWIDFNLDGDWADPGEQVLTDAPMQPGPNSRTLQVPATALIGPTYARFRFSTTGGLFYNGQAPNGEVEDYQINIGTVTPPTPGPSSDTAPPDEHYYSKWFQPADDINADQISGWPESSLYHAGPILADDWQNDGPNLVIGVRWWGSFYGWTSVVPPPIAPDAFHVAIWSDGVGGSSPGSLVWEGFCENWSWAYAGVVKDPRALSSGQACFEFVHLFSQDDWFRPSADTDMRYWISIAAKYDTNVPNYPWAWMTRKSAYEGAATAVEEIQGTSGPWPPSVGSSFAGGTAITYPFNTPWDMSFDIISRRSDSAPANTLGGADVNGDGMVDVQDLSALMRLWLND